MLRLPALPSADHGREAAAVSALHLRTNGPKGSRERAALGAPRPRPPPCRACALPARVGLCKMASGPSRTAAEEYRPNRYVSLPAELDPATYDTSLEKRRAEAERLAIRARLKRQYLLQLNNPKPPAVIVSGAGGAGGGSGPARLTRTGAARGRA